MLAWHFAAQEPTLFKDRTRSCPNHTLSLSIVLTRTQTGPKILQKVFRYFQAAQQGHPSTSSSNGTLRRPPLWRLQSSVFYWAASCPRPSFRSLRKIHTIIGWINVFQILQLLYENTTLFTLIRVTVVVINQRPQLLNTRAILGARRLNKKYIDLTSSGSPVPIIIKTIL